MNVTTLTRNSARQFAAALPPGVANPDSTTTLDVSVGPNPDPVGDNFILGCRFHALLNRIKDHGPLSSKEKEFLPWLNAIRDELRKNGVTYIEPEVPLEASAYETSGQCDLYLTGGLADVGVAELKICTQLPASPAEKPLCQLSSYAELIGAKESKYGETRVWGVLIFVSIAERKVRLFSYKDTRGLRNQIRPLMAA